MTKGRRAPANSAAPRTGSTGTRSPGAPSANPSPFAGLGALLPRVRAADGKPAPETLKPTAGQRAAATDRSAGAAGAAAGSNAPQAAPADDDTALFRQTIGQIEPIRAQGRVRIEAPKPPPVPRPRDDALTSQDAPPAAIRRPTGPLTDTEFFHAAVRDVTPLRDDGRLHLERPAAPHHRRSTAATADEIGTAPRDPTVLDGGKPDRPVLPTLSDTDAPADMFRRAVGAVEPLPDRNRAAIDRPLPPPRPRQTEADRQAVLQEAISAPLSFEDRLDMGDEAAFLRDGIARRVLTDLRRGRWVVQAELDLHGLTREEARDALAHFLAEALQQGRRCLRLIHGKGLGSPGQEPVLKHLSRAWLARREDILAFCQARPQDGGEGALLILLRAPRGDRAAAASHPDQ